MTCCILVLCFSNTQAGVHILMVFVPENVQKQPLLGVSFGTAHQRVFQENFSNRFNDLQGVLFGF